MKITHKLIVTILILVLLPSISIGLIAFKEAEKSLGQQATANINMIIQEVNVESQVSKDIADTIHKFVAKNISTNMNVARKKFTELCGETAEIDGENLVCETGLVINDKDNDNNIVKEVMNLAKGPSSIFVKIDNKSAKKISTTVTKGIYKYGYIMEGSMYDKVIKNGQFFNKYSKIKGVFKTKNCDPIKNIEGENVGALCVGIPETEAVNNIIEKFEDMSFGNEGQIYVVSVLEDVNYGKLVAHKTKRGEDVSDVEHIKKMLEMKNGNINYTENGEEKTASFVYYEPYEWIIVAEENLTDFKASIAGVRNNILMVSLLFLVVAIIVGVVASRAITNPIKKLTVALNKVAEGDLDAEIPEIKTKDEIGELSDSASLLVGAIKFHKNKK